MKRHNKTSLFLMELILSILLFSLCSAVCVQLFVAAYRREQDAEALTWAAMLCDSMASQLRSKDALAEFSVTNYDSSFAPCEKDAVPAWRVMVIPGKNEDDPVRTADFFVFPCPSASFGDADPQALYHVSVAY